MALISVNPTKIHNFPTKRTNPPKNKGNFLNCSVLSSLLLILVIFNSSKTCLASPPSPPASTLQMPPLAPTESGQSKQVPPQALALALDDPCLKCDLRSSYCKRWTPDTRVTCECRQGFQRSKTSGHCVMIRTPSPSAQSSRYGDFATRVDPSLKPLQDQAKVNKMQKSF